MNMKVLGQGSVSVTTLLAPVLWGTTYVTITELLPADRPLLLSAARVVPAGVLLLGLATVLTRWRPRGPEWGRTVLLALANFGVFFPLLTVAVYRLPGGVAAAVGGLQPLLVLLLSWSVAGRRPLLGDVAVSCFAAAGVALVVVEPQARVDVLGVLAAVGANLSFALGVVLTKHFPAPSHRIASTGWQLLLSGAVLVPLALLLEGAPPVPTATHVGGYLYLSVVATGVAFLVWFAGVRRLPPVAPPLLGLAAPVTGAVAGWLLLAEQLTPQQLVGFAVTFLGISYGALRGAGSRAGRHGPA